MTKHRSSYSSNEKQDTVFLMRESIFFDDQSCISNKPIYEKKQNFSGQICVNFEQSTVVF